MPRGSSAGPSAVRLCPRRGAGSPRVSPAASPRGPDDPTLRANPYPEVTDLFCRLPLPTLFYQLEAVHLGDLLRL